MSGLSGQPTDGSSGNSQSVTLKNSGIEVIVSAMLSFQKDGKTYDGNGTLPDIFIEEDENQVLNGYDSQLAQLIAFINLWHSRRFSEIAKTEVWEIEYLVC